jgi:hypothetical protein
MGVNTFLLDRRTAVLMIGGSRQTVGTLRRFFKLTELDLEEGRAAVLDAADAAARITPSPAAAMNMDIAELPLADKPGKPVAAHLVLGWDEGRGSVTDFGWDYLPQLGYAVRNAATQEYVLFELQDELLYPIDAAGALDLGLLDAHGNLIRHGQPVITGCENVRPFLDRYADADCTLSSGATETLMTTIEGDRLPPAEWFIGKTPREVAKYPPERPGGSRLALGGASPKP